jgi:glyoxylase-like metal-dependent hydrolase (beta-lactamase superfamily II)
MAERLAAGIWQLRLGWPAPLRSNAYLVDDGTVTLIDAGLPLNANRLRDELEDAGGDVAEIDRVLLTHYDIDHVGGLARLVPELDAPVYMGEADLALLEGGQDPPWLHHKGLFHRGLRLVHGLPEELSVRSVADGDRIGGFRAHHTPGHNPGHTVYVHAEMEAGLLGDLVWSKPRGLVTPIWLDSYDLATLRASVRRLAERAAPFDVAAVGHGEPLRTGGRAALRELAARL